MTVYDANSNLVEHGLLLPCSSSLTFCYADLVQDPNIGHEEVGEDGDKRDFYDNSEEEGEGEDEEKLVIDENKVVKTVYKMDPDHRLVLILY
jgi:hypothetical protein